MPWTTVPLDGGLDLMTAPQAVQPGKLIDCQNYEVAYQRGYRRIDGVEPFDGGPSPSGFAYYTFQFSTNGVLGTPQGWVRIAPTTEAPAGLAGNFQIYSASLVSSTWTVVGRFTTEFDIVSMNLNLTNYQVFPAFATANQVYAVQGGIPVVPVSKTVQQQMSDDLSYFGTISGLIQPVPGNNNVNGLFWLTDRLYATRDYAAFDFTAGTHQPTPGDVIYQGSSFGSATWTGVVTGVGALTSGTWSGTGVGTLAYYPTGTTNLPTPTAIIKNHSAADVAVCTANAGDITASLAAGLYVATGQRGNTLATQSWQLCDLGFNVNYGSGSAVFSDLSVVSPLTPVSTPYEVTDWKHGTTGSQTVWTNVPAQFLTNSQLQQGTVIPFPQNISGSIYGMLTTNFTATATPTAFTVTGFGFTNADIPNGTVITGIEIQMNSGANSLYLGGTPNTYTDTVSDNSLTLTGVGGPTPNMASATPYHVYDVPQSWNSVDHTFYAKPTLNLQDYGPPTTVADTPTNTFGYTGISAASITSANFGIVYSAKLTTGVGTQPINFYVNDVKIRFSYQRNTSNLYFWNGSTAVKFRVVQHYKTSGLESANAAVGTLYIQFQQAGGDFGGLPARTIAVGEQIRAGYTGTPDGGVVDGSTQAALTTSTANLNVMDHTAIMQGVALPDGTMAPPSKYQSVTKNFFASSGFEAIYGVSGAGPAFYYDGIRIGTNGVIKPGNFSRILTGLALNVETPRSVTTHQGHLMLGYYHGVVQWSNTTNVLSFDPTLWDQSAGDNGFGDNVIGIQSVNGETLAVWTKTSVQMMQGNFNSPSTLYDAIITPTQGGIEYTIQPMISYIYCDPRGITTMGASQGYGDFELNHMSAPVSQWLVPRLQRQYFMNSYNKNVINSVLVRNKNQYRTFYNDGMVLTMTFLAPNEPPQFTFQNYNYQIPNI